MIYYSQQHQKSADTQAAMMNRYHTHDLSPNQCGSILVQKIKAPLHLVWLLVRQFAKPQGYKQFVRSCTLRAGDGGIGSVREVSIVSGMPAETSTERLDELDDELHLMMFSMIGGDHRLVNYQSTTTLHEDEDDQDGEGGTGTVLMESYVVDTPNGTSKEDTCSFADTIIGCNLKCLARITEKMASKRINYDGVYI